MMTANEFQNARRPALLPSDAAFPPEQYPDNLICGSLPPILPHQAQVLFTAPDLRNLPPITSLFRRAYTALTNG